MGVFASWVLEGREDRGLSEALPLWVPQIWEVSWYFELANNGRAYLPSPSLPLPFTSPQSLMFLSPKSYNAYKQPKGVLQIEFWREGRGRLVRNILPFFNIPKQGENVSH